MLEAIACGTPVAAYPVTGPVDIIKPGINGYLNESLSEAIIGCRRLDRKIVEDSSLDFSWSACTDVFERNLVCIPR